MAWELYLGNTLKAFILWLKETDKEARIAVNSFVN